MLSKNCEKDKKSRIGGMKKHSSKWHVTRIADGVLLLLFFSGVPIFKVKF